MSADPAADLAEALARWLASVLAAAEAAFGLVTSALPRCVRAEPAADFAAALARELASVSPAADPALWLVPSLRRLPPLAPRMASAWRRSVRQYREERADQWSTPTVIMHPPTSCPLYSALAVEGGTRLHVVERALAAR